jgi:hypothetical protein
MTNEPNHLRGATVLGHAGRRGPWLTKSIAIALAILATAWNFAALAKELTRPLPSDRALSAWQAEASNRPELPMLCCVSDDDDDGTELRSGRSKQRMRRGVLAATRPSVAKFGACRVAEFRPDLCRPIASARTHRDAAVPARSDLDADGDPDPDPRVAPREAKPEPAAGAMSPAKESRS